MAIKKTVDSKFGIEIKDAYHRVECIVFVEKTKIKFQLLSFGDVKFSCFNEETYYCEYDLNGGNPYQQAYLFLKSTDKFKNAIDC